MISTDSQVTPLAEVIKQCLFQGKIPQSLTTFKAPFTEPISSDVIT